MVHGLEQQYEGQIDFVFLNIDDPETRASKEALGFRFQPHFLLLDTEGEILQEWLGYTDQAALEQAFDAQLSAQNGQVGG